MKKIFLLSLLFFFASSHIIFAESYSFDPNEPQPSDQNQQTSGSSSGSSDSSTSSDPAPLPKPKTRYAFELNANTSDIEGRFGIAWPILPSTVHLDLNGIYSGDDYWLISSDFTFGNEILSENFTVGIGLKGVYGEAEEGINKSSVGAIGFIVKILYDFDEVEVYYDTYMAFGLSGELCGSPEPLSFSDTRGYMEARTSFDIYLNETRASAIRIGYRYIKMKFNENDMDWDATGDGFYLGYKIRF